MRTLGVCALVLMLWAPALSAREQQSGPRYHTVYSGQRLGSIAKRYGVTVEALCNANDIDDKRRIRPGQKLLIPSPDDPKGEKARAKNPSLAKSEPEKSRAKTSTTTDKSEEKTGEITHRVYSGQRLGSIAKRYRITVDELCAANKIKRTDVLRPGQILIIPDQPLRDTESERASEPEQATRGKGSWHRYARTPRRKGYIELQTYTRRYRGQVVDRKGKLSSKAAAQISDLLGAGGSRPRIDPRLIKLLVQLSDKFGGRAIRVVSGYRTQSFYNDSRHKTSRAIDFSIPGVPNEVLRDYLRTFRNAGVGYYPNSTFVHLDVRQGSTYWVDYAGPGEAPRRDPHRSHPTNHEAEIGEPAAIEQEQRGASAMPQAALDAALKADSDSTKTGDESAIPASEPAKSSGTESEADSE